MGALCVSNTKQPNPTGVDDLWHAAVNGRGAFVNASNAKELRNGMEQILNSILQVGGARTGSANPNPNFSATNNFIYTVRFEKGWEGSVQKIQVDPNTGVPLASRQSIRSGKRPINSPRRWPAAARRGTASATS